MDEDRIRAVGLSFTPQERADLRRAAALASAGRDAPVSPTQFAYEAVIASVREMLQGGNPPFSDKGARALFGKE